MNQIKQLFGQTAVYGMGIVLPRLLNYLLLTPFYTRVFLPEEYGVITELYAYVVFLIVILTYGLETGFFRFASKSNSNSLNIYSTVLSSIFTTSILFLIVLFLFRNNVALILGYEHKISLLWWLGLIVAIDAFSSIPFAYIRLTNQPVKYAIIRIIEVTVNIALNIFFLHYCPENRDQIIVQRVYNEDIGVGYVLISNLVASVIKLLLLYKELIIFFKGRIEIKLLKKVLKYSLPLLIAGLAGTVNEAIDRVLLKHLIPEQIGPMIQLGIYGANYKVAVMMTLFVQMFKYAAEPCFFSHAAVKNAKILYADVMKIFIISGLIIYLIVTLYIDYFKLFIGENFREGIIIVPVILFANLLMGIFFNLSIWYKLNNKTVYGAVLVIIGALITLTVNIIFIPKYSYYASAWGHLIAYSVMVVLSYLFSRKHYRINYDLSRIFTYISIALFIYWLDKQLIVNLGKIAIYYKTALIILAIAFYIFMERKNFMKYNT